MSKYENRIRTILPVLNNYLKLISAPRHLEDDSLKAEYVKMLCEVINKRISVYADEGEVAAFTQKGCKYLAESHPRTTWPTGKEMADAMNTTWPQKTASRNLDETISESLKRYREALGTIPGETSLSQWGLHDRVSGDVQKEDLR